jgi:hypothetical protein
MNFHPRQFWKRLHWATRIAMLTVLLAILWWQARYTLAIGNPMYGWPMPFNNVWYEGWHGDWRPSILIVDAPVWLSLTGAVGYTLERWRRKPKRFHMTLGGLFVLQGVAAAVYAIGCIEGYLRAHPNNGSMFPAYARWNIGSVSLWFDLGLFTDPPGCRPLIRLAVILAIGCLVYGMVCGVSSATRRVCGGRAAPAESVATENPRRDPLPARIILFVLVVVILLFVWGTLFPPAVR